MSKQLSLRIAFVLLLTMIASQSSCLMAYSSIEGDAPSQNVDYGYTLMKSMNVTSYNTYALTIDTGTLNDTRANNDAWFGGYHISALNNWFGELYLSFNVSQAGVNSSAVSEILVHYNTNYCAGEVPNFGGGFYIYDYQLSRWTAIYEKSGGWHNGTYVATNTHIAFNGEVRFKIMTYLARCTEYGYTPEQCTHYAKCDWLSIDTKAENQTTTLYAHYWASSSSNTTYRLDFGYDFPIKKTIETSEHGLWAIYNGSEQILRKYKAPIIIKNTRNETLIDFQIKLTTDYDSRMTSDFSDLAIAYYNSASKCYELIPAWAEKISTGKNATMWIKVPILPANILYSASNTTYFIFFGNISRVTAYWNIEKVFVFLDDFEGTCINQDKWMPVSEGLQISSTYAYNGSKSAMRDDGYGKYGVIKHIFGSLSTGIITIWFYDDGTPKTEAVFTSDGTTSFFTGRTDRDLAGHYFYRIGGSYASTGIGFSTGWHNVTFIYTGNEAKLYFDNLLVVTTVAITRFNTIELGDYWSGAEYPYGDVWFDFITVRKYASSEPTTSVELTGEEAAFEECWVLLKKDDSVLVEWTVEALENQTNILLETKTTNSTGYANFNLINNKTIYFKIVSPRAIAKAISQAYSANLHLNLTLISYGEEEIACAYPNGYEILNITCVSDEMPLFAENYTVDDYNATHRQVKITNNVINAKGEQFRLYATSVNVVYNLKAYCDGNETTYVSPHREIILNVAIMDPYRNPISGQRVSIGYNASNLVSVTSHADGVASVNFTTPSEYSMLYIYANTSGNYCGLLIQELMVPSIDITLSLNKVRVNINDSISIFGMAKYSTDGVNVPSGVAVINGTSCPVSNGAFSLIDRKDAVGKWTYILTNLSGTSVRIVTSYPSINLTWDRIKVVLCATSPRVNVNHSYGLSYHGVYECDSALWNGNIILNNTNTFYSTIGERGFEVAAVTDPIYGLRAFTSNSISITWDGLRFDACDINTSNQKARLKLDYASDNTPAHSGVIEYAGRFFITDNDGWATINLLDFNQIAFNSSANPIRDYAYGITYAINAFSLPLQINRTVYKDFLIKSCYPAKNPTYEHQRLSFEIDVPAGGSCDVELYSAIEPKLLLIDGQRAPYNYSFRVANFSITSSSRVDVYYGIVKIKEFSYDEAAKRLILKVYPDYRDLDTVQWNETICIKDPNIGAPIRQQSIMLNLPDCNVKTSTFDESDLEKPTWYNATAIIYDPELGVEVQRSDEIKFDPPNEAIMLPAFLTNVTSYLSYAWPQLITAIAIVEAAYASTLRKGLSQIVATMLITIVAVTSIAMAWPYLSQIMSNMPGGRVVAQARIMGKTAIIIVENNEKQPIDVFHIDIEGVEISVSESLIDPGYSMGFMGKACGAEKGRIYAISVSYVMNGNECITIAKAMCE